MSRGLVLYESLKEHTPAFRLFVLCLDDYCFDFFNERKDEYSAVECLKLEDLEAFDKDLLAAKGSRTRIEYYFTLSPCLPLFLLEKYSLSHICSLDADLFFLRDPGIYFSYLDEASIVVTPHKFSTETAASVRYGIFNVSFQIFRNDGTGVECLKRWRNQCIEWCGDMFDEANNRFADQKYLDEWPALYAGKIKIIDDASGGIAVWNLNNYRIEKTRNGFESNGEALIFYHFHYFKFITGRIAINGFNAYHVKKQKGIDDLYLAYWLEIDKKDRELSFAANASTRDQVKQRNIEKILDENGLYYRPLPNYIMHVNFCRLPDTIKRILKKAYA